MFLRFPVALPLDSSTGLKQYSSVTHAHLQKIKPRSCQCTSPEKSKRSRHIGTLLLKYTSSEQALDSRHNIKNKISRTSSLPHHQSPTANSLHTCTLNRPYSYCFVYKTKHLKSPDKLGHNCLTYPWIQWQWVTRSTNIMVSHSGELINLDVAIWCPSRQEAAVRYVLLSSRMNWWSITTDGKLSEKPFIERKIEPATRLRTDMGLDIVNKK